MSPTKSDDSINTLRTGWQAFCRQLEEAGEQAFLPHLPSAPKDRMTGLRQVARNIALALQFEVENADPEHPVLAHYFDPMRKQGGDNPDALYLGAPIDGKSHYRITGTKGSADYLVLTTVNRGPTPFGGGVAGTLMGDNIETEPDGSFEINIGPEECGPNWIPTSPDTYRVTIRQFFSDWEKEVPMRALIEKVGSSTPRPIPSPAEYIERLHNAGEWLKTTVQFWANMLHRWHDRPGTFLAYSELDKEAGDATPGGEPVVCYWKLKPDEAMVVRVTPPEAARYWAAELGNGWWESMDYRDRMCSTNRHHATFEEDGELILVVSHEDPGVPNWLDASGHSVGYLTFRWIGLETSPRPETKVMPLSAVKDYLKDKQQITDSGRQQQLSARRRGLQLRGLL